MKKILLVLFIICIITSSFSVLTSCQRNENADNELSIVCTIFPYYDICAEILGSHDNITLLNNTGTDLHNYEPTLRDIKLISQCDVFVYGGGMSDSWVENTVMASQNENVVMIRLMDHLCTYNEEFQEGMQNDSHDHSHDDHDHDHEEVHEIDEHVWLSLDNAQTIAKVICETAVEIDPQNAEKYNNNLLAYTDSLTELDSSYSELFSNAEKPLVFADRFPFRYFTEAYDLTYFAAFPGCSTESFASFNTIAFLIKTVNDYDIDYILTIDTQDVPFAQTIAKETGSKILTLNSCQSITQGDIDNGITYLSIMKSNYDILSEVFSK